MFDLARSQTAQPMAKVTVDGDLIRLWLHDKSANSRRGYQRDVMQFLTIIGDLSLSEVTLNELQAFSNALGAKGYAVSTVSRKLAAAFEFADLWLSGRDSQG